MVKQIIAAQTPENAKVKQIPKEPYLNISEFYYDTIQGEGVTAGMPAAFLRLQGCHLGCSYCDTKEVWRFGNVYSFSEIFDLMNSTMIIPKLQEGQHLVITGGSPLLQQEALLDFLKVFYSIYRFEPYVEIENECSIMPVPELMDWVEQWNNSPKLSSSGVSMSKRYFPDILHCMSHREDSWFKFVVSCEKDWEEIQSDFLTTGLINMDQITLMPQGATREELEKNRETVVNMAIQHDVRYSDRLHVELWSDKKGV
jgi:organic radical activating enzyme